MHVLQHVSGTHILPMTLVPNIHIHVCTDLASVQCTDSYTSCVFRGEIDGKMHCD